MSFLIGVVASAALVVPGCGGGSPERPAPPVANRAVTGDLELGRNVVRLPGISPGDVSAAAAQVAYEPSSSRVQPDGWVLVPDHSWPEAVLGAQFAAAPVSAGLVAIDRQFIPPGPGDVMARIEPTGFPKADGLEALVLGKAGSDVYVDLQDLELKPTALTGEPAELAATLVPFRGGWAREYSDSIVVVSAEARDYALPAAAWSAYSGDTIAFVTRDTVPEATRELLVQREKLRLRKPAIYVIGPPDVISDAAVRELRRYGAVTRVGGDDAVETAVALARFHDPATGFGWGLRKGPASLSLVSTANWAQAIGAFNFAAAGPQAPLLLTDRPGELPEAVTSYLGDLQGKEPSQAYLFGDETLFDSHLVSELDRLLEARS